MIKSGTCTQTTAQVVVGDRNSDTYVYDESYYWNGSRWVVVNLSGSPKQGKWIGREGTGSIPLVADRTWYVAYTCQNVGGQWRCGCANSACGERMWQVQGFVRSTPSTAGGGTSHTGGSGTAQCPLKNDLFLNPFNKDSAHHRPIGTGAVYADVNHPAVRDWNKKTRFGVNVGFPYGSPVVATNVNDPLRTMRWDGTHGGHGMPVTLNLPATFRPTGYIPGRDNVLILFDTRNADLNELFLFEPDGNEYKAALNRKSNARNLGHGTRNGERIGTSAAGISMAFGALRGAEINTPGMPIRHALQVGVGAGRVNEGGVQMLSREIILPATAIDGYCVPGGRNYSDNHCRGNIPYGALMALPPNVNIDAMGLSEPGKRLAEAIRDYGIYVVDTGGGIRADQEVRPEIVNQLMNDIPKFYPHIRMVTNSAWTPGQAAVGGGQPIAPNCAFDS